MMWRILTLALLWLLVARQAQACQCGERPTVPVAAARSDVVAIGRISRIAHAPGLRVGEVHLEDPIVATMVVEASWKRRVHKLEIISGFSDCEYRDFTVGQRYLVFAASEIPSVGKHDTVVWAPRCWPTQQQGGSGTLLPELGEPMFRSTALPDRGVTTRIESSKAIGTTRGVLTGVLVLALALGISAVALFRR